MKIIPVLDLMGRQVVRGVAGRRKEYRPIVSQLGADAAPLSVARALVERFAFAEAYVADLDAIGGGEPDWKSYRELAGCGLRLWIDAGVASLAAALRLRERLEREGTDFRLIAGLETLDGPESLRRIVDESAMGQVIFSLDLKDGAPLTSSPAWQGLTAPEIAETAAGDCRATAMILLDLANVGMGQGVATCDLAREIRRRHPAIELIGGGGVRSIDDLKELARAGFDAVLIASALHDGRLTPNDVHQATQ
jgi:phosphoribosylformimino-5-aminoimidazole carboxamide ribotide isomerase